MTKVFRQLYLLVIWLASVSLWFLLFATPCSGSSFSKETVTESSSDDHIPCQPRLSFRNIPGLNNNQVTSFCQDQFGFLWIGTLNGLHRYDGTNIELFLKSEKDSTSLIHDRVDKIFEDSYGNLWIGTSNGICRYNRDKNNFDRFDIDGDLTSSNAVYENRILGIEEDLDGVLWIVSDREGLFYFDDDLQHFESFFIEEDLASLTSIFFSSLAVDKTGQLWLGTYNSGINVLDTKTRRIEQLSTKTHFNFSSDRITSIVVDAENIVWVGTEQSGIDRIIIKDQIFDIKNYHYDPKSPNSLLNNDIESLCIDKSNQVWSCNDNGGLHLYNEHLDGFYRYTPDNSSSNSLSSISIWTIYEDDEGRYWVGTGLTGMDVYDPNYTKIEHYYVSPNSLNGLSSNVIRDFAEDDDGNVWVATDGGGLNYFDRSTHMFESYQHDFLDENSISANAALALTWAPNKKLWVGTWSYGLNIFDTNSKKFERVNAPANVNIDNIMDMLTDQEGNIWLATYAGGLVKFDWNEQKFQSYMHSPGDTTSIGVDMMYTLFQDSHDDLYIGVRNEGLNILKKEDVERGKFLKFVNDIKDFQSIPSNVVNQVYEDSKGVIWVATSKGLRQFDRDKKLFMTVKGATEFDTPDVRSVIEDDNGILWIRTLEGISSYNLTTGDYQNYSSSDGIQKGSIQRHTLFKTKNGELLFAGSKGFNMFHPDSLKVKRMPSKVYFTDLKIFNKSVEIGTDTAVLQKHISRTKSVALPHECWKFTLEFVALNFTRSENNQYAYIMDGLESDWNFVGNELSATYTHLPPGKYTFKVKAANNEGVWNEEGVSLGIIILPAWWQTWWANVLYVVLVVVLFLSFIKWRTRKLQRDRYQLESMIDGRMMELKEKNTEIILQAEELKRKNEELAILNSSITEQAEELKSYNDALNEMNENLEKIVENRTHNLKIKNQELMTYSFENAHNVRGPLTRIMGLINLAKTDKKSDIQELVEKMEQASNEMDQITRSIGEKLDEHFKNPN